MNLMELLLQVDARLGPLIGVDEPTLQVVIDEVAAGPRPTGVAPEVEPQAVLAGQLVEIESECRMLRELLHVELTTVAHLDMHVTLGTPYQKRTPNAPNALDEPQEPDEV